MESLSINGSPKKLNHRTDTEEQHSLDHDSSHGHAKTMSAMIVSQFRTEKPLSPRSRLEKLQQMSLWWLEDGSDESAILTLKELQLKQIESQIEKQKRIDENQKLFAEQKSTEKKITKRNSNDKKTRLDGELVISNPVNTANNKSDTETPSIIVKSPTSRSPQTESLSDESLDEFEIDGQNNHELEQLPQLQQYKLIITDSKTIEDSASNDQQDVDAVCNTIDHAVQTVNIKDENNDTKFNETNETMHGGTEIDSSIISDLIQNLELHKLQAKTLLETNQNLEQCNQKLKTENLDLQQKLLSYQDSHKPQLTMIAQSTQHDELPCNLTSINNVCDIYIPSQIKLSNDSKQTQTNSAVLEVEHLESTMLETSTHQNTSEVSTQTVKNNYLQFGSSEQSAEMLSNPGTNFPSRNILNVIASKERQHFVASRSSVINLLTNSEYTRNRRADSLSWMIG